MARRPLLSPGAGGGRPAPLRYRLPPMPAAGTLDLERLRRLAVAAARAGGEVVRGGHSAPLPETETKGRGDYVSAVDRAAEVAVLDVLHQGAPDIAVLAEESGGRRGDRYWAVDPLDGTTNFLRGFPVVGVSVGLIVEGAPVVGAVEAPLMGVSWSAAAGRGAHDGDGRRLAVRGPEDRGVVATGFPFRKPENQARYERVLEAALREFEDLRRAGAASLDLAYSAAGAFDGYFELGLSTWDVAAGAVLVREAGGVVTDWSGDPMAVIDSGDILAGAPGWHERMLSLIRAAAAPRSGAHAVESPP